MSRGANLWPSCQLTLFLGWVSHSLSEPQLSNQIRNCSHVNWESKTPPKSKISLFIFIFFLNVCCRAGAMAQRVKSLATKFHPKYSHGRRAPTPASCPLIFILELWLRVCPHKWINTKKFWHKFASSVLLVFEVRLACIRKEAGIGFTPGFSILWKQ